MKPIALALGVCLALLFACCGGCGSAARDKLYAQVVDDFRNHRYESAMEKLRPTLNEQGDRDLALNHLRFASCAMRAGQYDEARESLVTACGGHLLHARYIATQRDEAAARAVMDTRLASLMGSSRRAMPGAEATASIVIGYLSGFPESLDLYPDADFRVHLEMMFRMMATQAEFFGLYGVQTYHNDYADEEIVRWTGRLMRHYCIEGRTDWLTSDPYRLAHIANPGFTEGLKAWTVSMAEDGSVRSDRLPGFVEFRGNISYESDIVSAGIGETLAVMKRSAKAPNAISQTVKDLTPGALYSLRFFAADYGDIRNALSEEKKLAVSVEIENTDLLPEKSFVHVGKSTRSYAVGFPDGAKPGWLNYCRLVFRAKGNEGKLTISDWAAPHEPAGPVGQEILFSFIKIQPCIED